MPITTSTFGTLKDQGINLYLLENAKGMQVKITPYGATVTSISIPSKEGRIELAAGFDSLDGYFGEAYQKNAPYFGCTVGRYASRIKDGKFSIDGTDYQVYANAAGRPAIHAASQAAGNPEWVTAVVVMFVIYVAGALFVMPYFLYQLTKKGFWGKFKTPALGKNVVLTALMAILNFAASVTFAYAAYQLGKAGNTVGYAIFNTVCVAVAILTGLFTGEWLNASSKAKNFLYVGLGAMVLGVVIIALGNGMIG